MKEEKSTMKEEKSTSSATPLPEGAHKPVEKENVPGTKRWIRLSEERPFGSITGSEFRVWGGE